jgi:hypothetical protein
MIMHSNVCLSNSNALFVIGITIEDHRVHNITHTHSCIY